LLPDEPEALAAHLAQLHDLDRGRLEAYDRYYTLEQPLSYMHPEIFAEVADRIRPVLVAWPQLVVDSVEERLDVEGYRLPDQDAGDDDLWRVWQANDLDEESQLAHVDALALGRAYAVVGTNEDDADTPLVTVESPLELFHLADPRTRRVLAALRRWSDEDSLARVVESHATLYLPDRTIRYTRVGGGWTTEDVDEHSLGAVPVVPITNRSRLTSRRLTRPALAGRYGRSDLEPIVPISDAACKIATDMMLAAEFHAIPLRGFMGMGPDDLRDQDGRPITKLQAIMSRLLLVDDPEARHFEFAPSSLANYHETINQLARIVASISGIPPHYLGFTTDNPASADAIRSAESRLVKRAERKQRAFGGAWEQAMRLVRRLQTGEDDPAMRQLETAWRDASTPTVAQKADATAKLHSQRIIDTEQAQEDLGYTDAQRKRMRERRANVLDRVLAGDLAALEGPKPPRREPEPAAA
jgi:Phage portal protein, SPP1 Gp6-like